MAGLSARRIAGRVLPQAIKTKIHGLVARTRTAAEIRAAARRGMVPPSDMWTMVAGAGDFVGQGRQFFDYLVEHARLSRHSAVLDIGCGIGRHAIHFAGYLEPPGRYEGFDVEARGVRWCKAAITRRHPHIRFKHVALQNERYNSISPKSAAEFEFPYKSSSFDLVFLGSVFTHMFTADVRNYIQEIARVLKPGGVCIATAYLLNDEKREGMAAGGAAFSFAIPHAGCWIEIAHPPEAAVAHEESGILDMLEQAGLRLVEPLHYGLWHRTPEQDQDFILCGKPA